MINKNATDRLVYSAVTGTDALLKALQVRFIVLNKRFAQIEAAYYESIKVNGEDHDRTLRLSDVLTRAENRRSRLDERQGWILKARTLLDDVRLSAGRPRKV